MWMSLFLLVGAFGWMLATPSQAEAAYFNWYGRSSYPYYWSGTYSSPNYAYSPYSRGYSRYYGNYGRYYGNRYDNFGRNYGRYDASYGTYPYYNWTRSYPWSW